MADPLVDLANFQEKVRSETDRYAYEGVVGAAQQIGALPERIANMNARMVEIAAQRMRTEQIQQQMSLMSQEYDLRAKRVNLDMMEMQARQQAMDDDRRRYDQQAEIEYAKTMAKIAERPWLSEDQKSVHRFTPNIAGKSVRWIETTSTDPADIEDAKRWKGSMTEYQEGVLEERRLNRIQRSELAEKEMKLKEKMWDERKKIDINKMDRNDLKVEVQQMTKLIDSVENNWSLTPTEKAERTKQYTERLDAAWDRLYALGSTQTAPSTPTKPEEVKPDTKAILEALKPIEAKIRGAKEILKEK